jgi:hypothetical protein
MADVMNRDPPPSKMAHGLKMPAEIVVRSPLLRRLFDHWRGLGHGFESGGLPHPRDLDPVAVKWALGWISLVDVTGAPPDCEFRYALDGTWQAERYGFDMTGKSLDAFPEPQTRALIRETYLEVASSALPRAHLRDLTLDGRRRRYEVLLLPFGEGKRVTRLAVALDFESRGAL